MAARAVRVETGCRVDFGGGTLDIWPLGLLHPGSVTTNLAVEVPVSVELRTREQGFVVVQGETRVEVEERRQLVEEPDGALVGVVAEAFALPPVEVRIASSSPRGGGLGASSAINIALIAAAERIAGREETTLQRRAELARDLEARLMRLPTGSQDFFPPQLGGAAALHHRPGGVEVRPLDVDLDALGRHLLVVYSGDSHFSAGQNWQVVRRRLDGEAESVRLFAQLAAVSARIPAAFGGAAWEELGEMVSREWSYRRQLAEGIATEGIDRLLDRGKELGAWGGKACGAGGGGCVLLLVPAERREEIATGLVEAGGVLVDAPPRRSGLEVSVLPA